MASARKYRIYELTSANQIAGMRNVDCDSDQMAIDKAKEMLEDRELEIRHGARVVSRLRPENGKWRLIRGFTEVAQLSLSRYALSAEVIAKCVGNRRISEAPATIVSLNSNSCPTKMWLNIARVVERRDLTAQADIETH
jgi:hypothetical protein